VRVSLFHWLAAWPNVPFTIVLTTTVLFVIVQASGVLGMLGGADMDAETEADADADSDADQDVGAAPSLARALISPLGIGRIPLTLTIEVAGVLFGSAGLALNAPFIASAGGPPLISLAWTVPAGLIAAYGGSALLARLLTPIVDDRAQAATTRRELIGLAGTVISSRIDRDFGEVRIRDRSGHDLRVVCRLAPAEPKPLDEHEECVIVDVDDRGTPHVAALELARRR
jgi:hypothetical protein